MEVGRFGMKLSNGWETDGSGLIVTAPYAGLGLENYGKLYYFKGFITCKVKHILTTLMNRR